MKTPNLPARETLHMTIEMQAAVVKYQHRKKLKSKQAAYRKIITSGLIAEGIVKPDKSNGSK